jgi:hypothetical protein
MKPDIGGGDSGIAAIELSGVVGGGAWGKMSQGTWETREADNRGSRTAHSSEETSNDRGAKGLNVNVQL